MSPRCRRFHVSCLEFHLFTVLCGPFAPDYRPASHQTYACTTVDLPLDVGQAILMTDLDRQHEGSSKLQRVDIDHRWMSAHGPTRPKPQCPELDSSFTSSVEFSVLDRCFQTSRL
ncbi:hypothetical protein MPTK1_7g02730 [Marchantia polymorpha subsp. ruderalis]|uniref:Secreted protein n=2 Tax=Marchantia polymorpha TaxID=3197 RepID=A0AAF6BVH1_MARPO|nr:hypothetical protein MARPO_0088s0015 [Marchantia polymorpha]BBN16005.1 hypothetical protein Mp_7g02730 [Marchantia polymorpha subsp. ruderalis]|eukprot:PTQ33466.1 hypothetical protein MARPO_0088s0015 [Marchantia polymorpha]